MEYMTASFFMNIVVLIIAVFFFVIGILMLRKYRKTKNRKYLVWGLILSLVIPGLIYMVYTSFTAMVAYAPPDMM